MYYYVHDGINASTSQRIPLNKPLIPSSLFHDPNYHNQLSARQCFCFSTVFWFHSSANYWCLLASGTLFQLNTNHINNNDGFFCSLFSFNNVKFCFATSVSIWFSVPWFVIGWLQSPFDSAQFTSRVWLWFEMQLQPDHHMMALLDLKLHGMFPADNAVFFISQTTGADNCRRKNTLWSKDTETDAQKLIGLCYVQLHDTQWCLGLTVAAPKKRNWTEVETGRHKQPI